MKRRLMQCALMLGGVVAMIGTVQAADSPKVLNVIAVKVKAGQQDAYLQKVKKIGDMMKSLKTGGTMRVWRATVAGQQTGMLYISTEYASAEAWAAGMAKAAADDAWQKMLRELDTSDMRELMGNSLLTDVTP